MQTSSSGDETLIKFNSNNNMDVKNTNNTVMNAIIFIWDYFKSSVLIQIFCVLLFGVLSILVLPTSRTGYLEPITICILLLIAILYYNDDVRYTLCNYLVNHSFFTRLLYFPIASTFGLVTMKRINPPSFWPFSSYKSAKEFYHLQSKSRVRRKGSRSIQPSKISYSSLTADSNIAPTNNRSSTKRLSNISKKHLDTDSQSHKQLPTPTKAKIAVSQLPNQSVKNSKNSNKSIVRSKSFRLKQKIVRKGILPLATPIRNIVLTRNLIDDIKFASTQVTRIAHTTHFVRVYYFIVKTKFESWVSVMTILDFSNLDALLQLKHPKLMESLSILLPCTKITHALRTQTTNYANNVQRFVHRVLAQPKLRNCRELSQYLRARKIQVPS